MQQADLDLISSSFSVGEEYLAKSSLFYLDKYILGFKDFTESCNKVVCEAAESLQPGERALFMLCRNSFKTCGISVGLPIKRLLNDPQDRIMLGGQERSYAIDILEQIKGQMVENSELIAINGGPFKAKRRWKEYEITVNGRTDWVAKEPSIGTCGIDSVKAGPHYPLIILDDPESDTNTNTIEACHKLIEQYKYFSPMLTHNPPGIMIVIGTPYSLDGLYMYILNTPAERRHYKVMIGQARKETALLPEISGEFTHLPFGPEGTYLLPKVLTKEKLDDEEEKDPVFFASQYLISFIAGAAQMFDPKWFRYYLTVELPDQLRIYIAVDPGYSKASTAAYTAIIVAGVDNLNNIFILKLIHARMTPDEITDKLYELYEEYQPFKIGVETNAIQTVFNWVFQKAAQTKGILPIFPLTARQASKEERIKGLVAPYKEGKIYHLARDEDKSKVDPTQQAIESQLIRFPGAKLKVDAIDAESMLLELIDVYYKKKVTKKKTHRYTPIDVRTGY